MTTAIVADDEPALVDHLVRALADAWPELDVVGTAGNGRAALELAESRGPDVAFLDIRMPGMTGLEVARALPAGTRVVFVTAHDDYAVQAFETAACDYLLKPVSADRLAATVARLRQQAGPEPAVLGRLLDELAASRRPDYLQWLRTGYGDTTRLVPVDEVVYFRADHKYTTVVTPDEEHVVRTPVKELEAELDPSRFWRVHRGLIVNVEAVREARRDIRGRYELSLRGRPETLRTSRAYAHLFRQM